MEPVNLPVLPCPFNKAAAYGPQDDSSGLTIHSHRFDCNWLKLMCLCKSSVFTALFAAVPASIADLFRCTVAKVQRSIPYLAGCDLSYWGHAQWAVLLVVLESR